MCDASCNSCVLNSLFYACTSCNSPLTLQNNICITQPNLYIQIVFTVSLTLFIIPQIFHSRRFATVIKLFDIIQIVYFFKYLVVYQPYRHQYLYLGFRSWGSWSEGWQLLNLDSGVGIWLGQEGDIDRSIRIFTYIIGLLTITLLIGIYKSIADDHNITLCKYIEKNWRNSCVLAIYFTAQDMALVIANQFYLNQASAFTFTTTAKTLQFIFALTFCVLIVVTLYWMVYIINYQIKQEDQRQNFYHANMFIFAFDYDIFQTYKSVSLDQQPTEYTGEKQYSAKTLKSTKKFKYSNLRIFSFIMKIVYPFLIVDQTTGTNTQLFGIAGFIIFFESLYWIVFPYQLKKQYYQITILAIGHILQILLLFTYGAGILGQYFVFSLCFSFFLLALISAVIQIFHEYYKLIPIDLYQTGMKVEINIHNSRLENQKRNLEEEKRKLLEQMQRLEEENKKKLLSMDQDQRIKQQARIKKQKQLEQELQKLRKQKSNSANINQKKVIEEKQKIIQQQRQKNMTEQEADLQKRRLEMQKRMLERYRLDLDKIQAYRWDKKKKFVYSHTIDTSV